MLAAWWCFIASIVAHLVNHACIVTRRSTASTFCRYDLQTARDVYRFACGAEGGNRRLLLRYIEVRVCN